MFRANVAQCMSTMCKALGLILKSANSRGSKITLMFALAEFHAHCADSACTL